MHLVLGKFLDENNIRGSKLTAYCGNFQRQQNTLVFYIANSGSTNLYTTADRSQWTNSNEVFKGKTHALCQDNS